MEKERTRQSASAGEGNERNAGPVFAESEGQERNAVPIQETGRIPTKEDLRRNEATAVIPQRSPQSGSAAAKIAAAALPAKGDRQDKNLKSTQERERRGHQHEKILQKQPIVVLQKMISIEKTGIISEKQKKTTEEQESEPSLHQSEEENTDDSQNSALFAEELEQLDSDNEKVYSAKKLTTKVKNQRSGDIKKHNNREKYKELQWEEIDYSRRKKKRRGRKRKKAIESMSEDSEYISKEEYIILDDDEYSEKSQRKEKSSKKKQKNDNAKKQTFIPEYSSKKQRNSTRKRYDFEPQQGTSRQSTFLMDIQNENPKQHQSKKIGKSGKRKNGIESLSEDSEWEPSKDEYTYIEDDEYSEKTPRKEKSSKKKKTNDNAKKQTFGPEQSSEKETTDNTNRYDFEPEQATGTQSTFLLDIENENPKKKSKKIRKSDDYIPPKKKKRTEEEVKIEIEKHILTIMAEKLKDKHVDKSHVQPEKLKKWKGTSEERKEMAIIYQSIPEKLKNLMRQNIELSDEEKVLVEGKIVKGTDGRFSCLDCKDKSFFKRREIYRHVRIVHSNASIMHVCGYDHCKIATNNTTTLGIHTVYEHFKYLFKNIKIPV